MRGSTRDVGGRILLTSKRNTTRDRRMLIPSVTCNEDIESRNLVKKMG